MLDWTDRHCRYFHRQISQTALLYTEMVTTGAIIHGKQDFLAYHETVTPCCFCNLVVAIPIELWQSAQGLRPERGYDGN